ncbi:hypothetical protein [Micromonospora sp. NPDC023956]|uniref:hypothetical protein n=1 Tax=Micromonospora sp. NPDC023956 TaxID=3155722 RepID=UPI0033FF8E44
MPAVVATGGFGPDAGTPLAGPALALGLFGIAVIGVRHALRHGRLVVRTAPGSGGPAGPETAVGSPSAAPAALHV